METAEFKQKLILEFFSKFLLALALVVCVAYFKQCDKTASERQKIASIYSPILERHHKKFDDQGAHLLSYLAEAKENQTFGVKLEQAIVPFQDIEYTLGEILRIDALVNNPPEANKDLKNLRATQNWLKDIILEILEGKASGQKIRGYYNFFSEKYYPCLEDISDLRLQIFQK